MPDGRRRRIARRFTVFGPAAIVLLTGLLAYSALQDILMTRRWVLHTRDVLDASSSLMIAVFEAETGQRGYLITDDTAFLDPYRGAATRATGAAERLRLLTNDNPLQQQRVDSVAALVRRRFAFIDSTLVLHRTSPAAAVRRVEGGQGRRLTDAIRVRLDSVDHQEEQLLVARRAAEARSTQITGLIILVGTVLAGLMAFLVNRNFDLALRQRRAALEETRQANERLTENAIELEHQADMAEQAAAAAEAASERANTALRAAQESERRAERLQAATEALTSAQSLEEVANLIVEQAMHALQAQSGAVAALDEDRRTLRFIAARNIAVSRAGSTVDVREPLPMCAAVRERQPVILESPAAIAAAFPNVVAMHAVDDVGAVVAYPLLADRVNDGAAVGVLLIRFTGEHRLSDSDRAFMHAMSRIASETIDRARLFDAERRARAAAEAANRAKAAFLASMSHELRTPLQAALGFSQLVRAGVYGPVNPEQVEVLSRVERSQTHLARLIDDILDFARLEAGRVRIDVEPVALEELMQEVVRLVGPDAMRKQLRLTTQLASNEQAVLADHQRLLQILLNLVGNAIKFTPTGGRVELRSASDDSRVLIHVRDTGVGIPRDRLADIFEPFVQVGRRLSSPNAGVGLGLAISRDLVRAMGGELTVESEPGQGSTFTLALDRVG